jgi:hypothetical protein
MCSIYLKKELIIIFQTVNTIAFSSKDHINSAYRLEMTLERILTSITTLDALLVDRLYYR